MRVYAALWLGWVGYFFAVELTALFTRHPEWTLSDFTWRLEGSGWTASRYVVLVFLLWLLFHLVWRAFR